MIDPRACLVGGFIGYFWGHYWVGFFVGGIAYLFYEENF